MYAWCLLSCVCSMSWLDDWLSRASEKKVDSGQMDNEGGEPVAKKALARAHMFILFEQGRYMNWDMKEDTFTLHGRQQQE